MSIKEIKKFDKLCGIWKGFDKDKHRLVIPDITSSLNTVIGVFIDNPSENYNAQGFFYNSLERHQQGLQMINPRIEEFSHWLDQCFQQLCSLVEELFLQQEKVQLWSFAIGICLHIFDGDKIDESIFHNVTLPI